MNIEIISDESDVLEFRIDNLTIAEILRVYLNNNGVKFVAWRRDHLTKPVIFRVESSGKNVRKVISEAISSINKDLSALSKVVSK